MGVSASEGFGLEGVGSRIWPFEELWGRRSEAFNFNLPSNFTHSLSIAKVAFNLFINFTYSLRIAKVATVRGRVVGLWSLHLPGHATILLDIQVGGVETEGGSWSPKPLGFGVLGSKP